MQARVPAKKAKQKSRLKAHVLGEHAHRWKGNVYCTFSDVLKEFSATTENAYIYKIMKIKIHISVATKY